MKPADLVVLSGGSESVSVAVAETAWRAGLTYGVVSLRSETILKGAPGCLWTRHICSPDTTPAEAGNGLVEVLQEAARGDGLPVPVFPTEDDGLLLLNLERERIRGIASFSRGQALSMGGLDKVELFQHLESMGLGELLAPTIPVPHPDALGDILDQLGDDAVIKPAYKPWGQSAVPGGTKVITRTSSDGTRAALKSRLSAAWSPRGRWLAQARLRPLQSGERSACIVRSRPHVHGCEVLERLKYPPMGGSAVVVDSVQSRSLIPLAAAIADAIDLVGLCELSFLADEQGRPRLLELNTRPWLQIALVEKSGYPIVLECLRALSGQALAAQGAQTSELRWIQPERLLLLWLQRGNPGGIAALGGLFRVLRSGSVWPVYGSRLPGIRRRWVMRMLKRLFRNRPSR